MKNVDVIELEPFETVFDGLEDVLLRTYVLVKAKLMPCRSRLYLATQTPLVNVSKSIRVVIWSEEPGAWFTGYDEIYLLENRYITHSGIKVKAIEYYCY